MPESGRARRACARLFLCHRKLFCIVQHDLKWHYVSRYIVLLYKTDKFEGVLKSSEEGEVFWMELEKLSCRQLSPGFMDVLKVFLDDELSEFYYYEKDGKWSYELK